MVALRSGVGESPGHGHMDRSCRAAACCLKPNPLRNEGPGGQTCLLPLFDLGSSGISGALHPKFHSLGAEEVAENATGLALRVLMRQEEVPSIGPPN